MSAMLSSIGVTRTENRWNHVATGTWIDEDIDVPMVHHELQLLRFEGEPIASGDVAEVHWMDVDAPTRPMTFVTEHLLLEQVRKAMGRGDLN